MADHRFKALIDAYGVLHEPSHDKMIAALKTVSWDDLTLAELPLYWMELTAQPQGDGISSQMLNAFYLDMDSSSLDKEAWLLLYAGQLQGDQLGETLRELRLASPQSPWITCSEILNNWNADKAREWELSHGGYPSIQLTLAKMHMKERKWQDAERCLRQYIRVSPDQVGYQTLASVYKSQGRDDQWLATLKEFLDKTEAVALEHAQVQVEIANYFMARRQYVEAVPFADAAAGTGASWGLQCAAWAHTWTRDFRTAEELLMEDIQHYGNNPYGWVAWCVETRRGHRDEAIRAFHEYVASRRGQLSAEDTLQLALVEEFEGKVEEAITELNKRFAKAPGPLSLIHVVIFADESDDAKARDAALKQIEGLHQGDPDTLEFARELAKAYRGGPASSIDLNAVDEIIRKTSKQNDQIEFRILTARHLLKRGRKDQAIGYLKQCYGGFQGYCVDNLLVYQTTGELGLDPLTLADPTTRPAK